jgi:hypothetical protein
VGLVIAIVVVGTSIWVAIDASRLEVTRGCLGGGFADSGPVGWFFCALLIWIIGFPAYLITRPKYVARRRALALSAAGMPGVPPTPSGVAAGWYPDPTVPGANRWWDGHQWGPSAPAPPNSLSRS